jgi:hypothetical protein
LKPTSKQLKYLRSLAQRTGQTFAWPQTLEDASREIERLQGVKKTPVADRRRERREVRDDMTARRGDAARVMDGEVEGYGSTARWAGREEAGR